MKGVHPNGHQKADQGIDFEKRVQCGEKAPDPDGEKGIQEKTQIQKVLITEPSLP
jgi:hypothetical protein